MIPFDKCSEQFELNNSTLSNEEILAIVCKYAYEMKVPCCVELTFPQLESIPDQVLDSGIIVYREASYKYLVLYPDGQYSKHEELNELELWGLENIKILNISQVKRIKDDFEHKVIYMPLEA